MRNRPNAHVRESLRCTSTVCMFNARRHLLCKYSLVCGYIDEGCFQKCMYSISLCKSTFQKRESCVSVYVYTWVWFFERARGSRVNGFFRTYLISMEIRDSAPQLKGLQRWIGSSKSRRRCGGSLSVRRTNTSAIVNYAIFLGVFLKFYGSLRKYIILSRVWDGFSSFIKSVWWWKERWSYIEPILGE